MLLFALSMLTTKPGENWLRRRIESQVYKSLGITVRIGVFETNLLSRIRISKLEVQSPESTSKLLSAAQVDVYYRFGQLLKRKLIIRSLIIDELEVDLIKDSAGTYNLPHDLLAQTPDSIKTPAAFEVIFEKLQVGHSRLHYNEISLPLDATIQALALQLNQPDSQTFQVELHSDSSRILYRETLIPFRAVDLNCIYTNEMLEISRLALTPFGNEIAGNGWLDLSGDSPGIEASLSMHGNTATLQELIRNYLPQLADYPGGEFEGQWQISGALQKPSVRLEHLQLDLLQLQLLASGSILLEPETPELQLQLRLNGDPQLAAELFRDKLPEAIFPVEGKIALAATISGALQKPSVQLEHLHLDLLKLRLLASGSILQEPEAPEMQLQLRLNGDPQLAAELFRESLPEAIFPVRGEIALTATVSGTAQNPSIEAGLDFPYLALACYELHKGNIRFRMNEKMITFPNLSFESLYGLVQGDGWLKLDTNYQHALHLSVDRLSFEQLWCDFYRQTSHYHGIVTGDVRSSGPLSDPAGIEMTADLRITEISYQSVALEDLTSNLTLQNGLLNYRLQYTQTEIRGQASLSGNAIRGDYRIRIDDLEPLANLVNIPDLKGSLYADGTLAGDIENPVIDAQISGGKLVYANFPVDELEADILYADGELLLRSGRITGKLSELSSLRAPIRIDKLYGSLEYQGTLSGSLQSPTGDFSARLANLRYDQFAADGLEVKLTVDKSEVVVQEALLYRDTLALDLSGRANLLTRSGSLALRVNRYDPRRQLLEPFKARIGASFNLADSLNWKGNLTIEDFNVAELQYFYAPLETFGGTLATEITFMGTPAAPRLAGKMTVREPAYRELQMEALQANFRFENDRISVPAFTFSHHGNESKANFEVQLSRDENGKFTFDKKNITRGHIESDGLDLALFRAFLPDRISVNGMCIYALDWSGRIGKPFVKGRMVLRDGGLTVGEEMMPLRDIRLEARFSEEQLTLDVFNFSMENRSFAITGFVNTKDFKSARASVECAINGHEVLSAEGSGDAKTLDAVLRLHDLDISVLNEILGTYYLLEGDINANIRMRGEYAAPQLTGKLELNKGALTLSSQTLPITEINGSISLADSILTLDRLDASIAQQPLHAEGQLITQDWKQFKTRLTVAVSGQNVLEGRGTVSTETVDAALMVNDFDLSHLQAFLTDVQDLSGRLEMQVSLRGQLQDPAITGNLTLNDLAFRPAAIPETFDHGLVKLRFVNKEMDLDTLFMRFNKGSVTAKGLLAYEGRNITDLDVRASLNNISYAKPRQFSIIVDQADLSYKKRNNYFDLEGDIVLGESRFKTNFQPTALVTYIQNADRPVPAPSPIVANTRLNIRIRESKKIWVDNNLARVRLKPQLMLIGSLADPAVAGRLTIEEGYILYLDRRFKVSKGIMDFTDPNRINPIIDFIAEAEIKSYQTLSRTSYKVSLALSGPADKIVMDLSSDPSLDRGDIISLLTIGATRDQLAGSRGDAGTNWSQVIQERLADYSSQKISAYTSSKVGNYLGLEQMSIEGNLFQFGKSWGPQLLASKKLSDKMSITYMTTVGKMNEQSIRLDYKLDENFSLEGQTDQRGRSGIDLKYKLKFK